MSVLVWIAFLLLQKSVCSQLEELVNSTEFSTNKQSSTVSYLNEVIGTNLSDTTDLESNTEISAEVSENRTDCIDYGGCSSQLGSSAPSAVSPKITWSPAASLIITSKDADLQTTVSPYESEKSKSETNGMSYPTTPDMYGTLNHHENELDFDGKNKGQYFTPGVNITMKSENLLDIVNATHSVVEKESKEMLSLLTSVPSENLEELIHLPTTPNDPSSEHFKVSSSDDKHLKFTVSGFLETSSYTSGQTDAIHISDTTPPSLRTVSQSDSVGTKYDESENTHPLFRFSRNTIPNDETENTAITDHSVLSAKLMMSSTHEAKLLITTTINPNSIKQNFTANNYFENIETDESSFQSHSVNLTNAEKSVDSTLIYQPLVSTTTKSIDDHEIIREVETVSSDTMYSTTIAHSLKEIHIETLPPDLSEVSGMQTSPNIDLTSPFITETLSKINNSLIHNTSSVSPFVDHISSEIHKTVEEIQYHPTEVTSTTVYHSTVDNSEANDNNKERTMDNNLFHFNEISISKGTTLPFEEKSTSPDAFEENKKILVTTTVTDGLDTSVDLSTLHPVRHSLSKELEITLTTAKAEVTATPMKDPQPSSSTVTTFSLENRPTFAVDPPTLSSTVDQPTFSTSTDKVSLSTNDKVSSIDKISPRALDQTTYSTVGQASSIPVEQSTSPSTFDLSTSSSVDEIFSSSVSQTSSSTIVEQLTSIRTIDQSSTHIVDHSTFSSSNDQKPTITIQQPTSSSSVDPTTGFVINNPSTTMTKENGRLSTQIEYITTLAPGLPSSTTVPETSVGIHVFPSMLLTSTENSVPNEETTSAMYKSESLDVMDPLVTTKPSFDYTSIQISNIATETHREGKHIPFSTESTRRETVKSSNEVIFVTSAKEVETTTINLKEMIYNQLYYEDLKMNDKSNVITAVVGLPSQDVDNMDINVKIAEVHSWLQHVLMMEFKNWTRDPFDESQSNDKPFGNVTLFYILPTPRTKSSNITMTFIVHNQWRNETLPVDFVLSILSYHSADLKQSMNATSVHFYHGLLMEDSDLLLPVILEKYGVILFTTALAVIGSALLICIVIVYRKRNRRSVHYLANSKLQHNMQESVGIDLTPAVVILQDEKKILNGNSKICDDEGWLVPIHEVPLAEDRNMPKVQDTKL